MTTQEPATALELLDLADVGDDRFTTFYTDVLVPSFPPDELMALEDFLPAGGALAPGVVAMASGTPIAGALGEYDPNSGVVLLAYLAARPDRRRLGVGERVLSAALKTWRDRLQPAAILAEVEDPTAHQESAYGDPAARLRFYERLGAQILDIPYVQPALRPDSRRVHGMLLISFDDPGPQADPVASYLRSYIQGCEGIDDPLADPDYRPLFLELATHAGSTVPGRPRAQGVGHRSDG